MTKTVRVFLGRIFEYLLISFVLLTSILSFYFWYIEKDPYVIFTIKQPTQVISAGNTVTFTRYVCPQKEVESIVEREIFGSGKTYPLQNIPYSKEKCGFYEFSLKTPDHLKSGSYEYRVTAKYNVNFMKKAVKKLEPIKFEIM